MLFNSIAYLLFFPAVLFTDLFLQRWPWARKAFLLGASYFFYANWDWRFLGLIWTSTLVDWFVGVGLGRSDRPRTRKLLLLTSLVVNLGLLGFYKYFDFFVHSANDLLEAIGFEGHLPVLRLLLPVGISFYTFQTLSYSIDVYRGKLRPARSFLDFALFVGFFPQLVAGPIVRAADFLPQLERNPRARAYDLSRGLYEILAGLIKKVVIADVVGNELANPFYNHAGLAFSEASHGVQGFGTAGALLGILAFPVQIYGDFAGYSQIAIGSARCLGFRLPTNFRNPLMARTMGELWTRWHISLSSWMRDYLYIPLGGSRMGEARTRRNVMVTNLVSGLWHGAGWNFVTWGGLNGVAILWNRRAAQKRKRLGIRPSDGVFTQVWQRLATFGFFAFTLLVFRRAPQDRELPLEFQEQGVSISAWEHYAGVIRALFRVDDWSLPAGMETRAVVVLFLALGLEVLSFYRSKRIRRAWVRLPAEVQGVALVIVLGLLSQMATARTPFFYFQF